MEKHTSALEKRAQELDSKVVSVEDRDEEIRLKMLPPYKRDATAPRDIYRRGLNQIAPPDLVANEPGLASREIVEVLTTAPQRFGDRRKLLSSFEGEGSIPSVAESALCLAVLDARLKHSGAKLDSDEAWKLARNLGVLQCLTLLYSQADGRFRKPTGVGEVKGILGQTSEADEGNRGSQARGLAGHWHQNYFDPIMGEHKFGKRGFNATKLMMAIVVWALHLTPDLSFSTSREIEAELGVSRDHLKEVFKYVGCTVQTTGQQLEAKLESVPRFNAATYYTGRARKKRRAG